MPHDLQMEIEEIKARNALAKTLDDLLRHKKSGAALPECYGDEIGARYWADFVRESDPNIQYTFQSEVGAIEDNGAIIAQHIAQDSDLDTSRLIVVEKGSGSKEALKGKSFRLMDCFKEAAMNVSLYANLEHSAEYRAESIALAKDHWPKADAIAIDADFNSDDPDIRSNNVIEVERPRIVMEFGSSRGNIATSAHDPRSFEEQTYVELQRRFAHDMTLCRDGGILILGSDANQKACARAAYVHPVHKHFAENIVYRGYRESALTASFKPNFLNYDPIWDGKAHVIRHTLIAAANQNFGILNASGDFSPACINKGEHFVLSHSIKWPAEKMIAAAESQGFKCLGVYYGPDQRVPIYVFKAIPQRKASVKLARYS